MASLSPPGVLRVVLLAMRTGDVSFLGRRLFVSGLAKVAWLAALGAVVHYHFPFRGLALASRRMTVPIKS